MPSSNWAGGSQAGWRKLRAEILAENREQNGGACQIALPGVWRTRSGRVQRCRGVADCVHHVMGRATTGDQREYLQAACTPCNEKLGNPMRRPDPPAAPVSRW